MAKKSNKEDLEFAKDLSRILQDNISKLPAELKLRKEITKALKEETDYAEQLNILAEARVDTQTKFKGIQSDVGKQFKEQIKTAEKIVKTKKFQKDLMDDINEKAESFTDNIVNGVEQLPIFGKLMAKSLNPDKIKTQFSSMFKANLKGMTTAGKGGTKMFGMLSAGARAFTAVLLANPIFLIAAVIVGIIMLIKKLVTIAMEFDKNITHAAQSLSISKDQAGELHHSLVDATREMKAFGVTSEDAMKTLIDANKELGGLSFGVLSAMGEQAIVAGQIAWQLGLSEEASGKLLTNATLTGQSVEEYYNSIAATTAEMNDQTGIGIKQEAIINSILDTSRDTLATFAGNTKELTKQVYHAQKLGINLDKAKNVSDGILDIEGSIAKEMEARVLLGKNIQFDQARALALEGKFGEAAEHVVKQFGSSADFAKMSYLQKKAAADAAGMELGELEKSLKVMAMQEKMGKQNIKRRDEINAQLNDAKNLTADQVQSLRQELQLVEKNMAASDAKSFKELQAQEAKRSAEEKFAKTMDKLKDLFVSNFDGLAGLVTKLAEFGQRLAGGESLIKIMMTDTGTTEAKMASKNVEQTIQDTKKMDKGEAALLVKQEQEKMLSFENLKGVGSSLMFEQIGNWFSGKEEDSTEAFERLLQTNLDIAKLQASQAKTEEDSQKIMAEAFGRMVGHTSSALGSQDAYMKILEQRAGEYGMNFKSTTADDFTINAHPKDTLVMAGGTKLGEGAETELKGIKELMGQLIQAVNQPVNLQFGDGTVQKISNRAGFVNKMSANVGLG